MPTSRPPSSASSAARSEERPTSRPGCRRSLPAGPGRRRGGLTVRERGILVTSAASAEERCGREQLVRSNPETIRRAGELLDQLDTLWRARIDQIGDILADDTKEGPPDEDHC